MPQLTEAGARNSAADQAKIQAIHDNVADLGASCDYGNTGSSLGYSPYEALRVEESAALKMDTSHDATRQAVSKQLRVEHGVTSDYYPSSPSVRDMFPDQVVYDHQGKTLKRKYAVDHKQQPPKVKLGKAVQVHVAYVPVSPANPNDPDNDGDNDTLNPDGPGGRESLVFFPEGTLLTERNIPKSERDKIPAEDFAGKNRSFPIATAADVEAALRSIGRAGADNYSADELRKRIIAIAKRKGFAVPQSTAKESGEPEVINLVESLEFHEDGEALLREAAGADVPKRIKTISPGWGASGYYTPEVLKRDGPKVFKAGTHMLWNHATKAEEAARPEGNLDHLAAVLTSNAEWDDNGPKGPGLYASKKVFSDYAERVKEKAPYIGCSIRARGEYREGEAEGRKGRIVTSLLPSVLGTVDYVTKAGAGGAILQESAAVQQQTATEGRETNTGEAMQIEEKELQTLREAAAKTGTLEAQVARLTEAGLLRDATGIVAAKIKDAPLHQLTKDRLTRELVAKFPLKEGVIDTAAFGAQIDAAIKESVAEFSEATKSGAVRGLGSAPVTASDLDEAQMKKLDDISESAFSSLGLSQVAAKMAVKGRNGASVGGF